MFWGTTKLAGPEDTLYMPTGRKLERGLVRGAQRGSHTTINQFAKGRVVYLAKDFIITNCLRIDHDLRLPNSNCELIISRWEWHCAQCMTLCFPQWHLRLKVSRPLKYSERKGPAPVLLMVMPSKADGRIQILSIAKGARGLGFENSV